MENGNAFKRLHERFLFSGDNVTRSCLPSTALGRVLLFYSSTFCLLFGEKFVSTGFIIYLMSEVFVHQVAAVSADRAVVAVVKVLLSSDTPVTHSGVNVDIQCFGRRGRI